MSAYSINGQRQVCTIRFVPGSRQEETAKWVYMKEMYAVDVVVTVLSARKRGRPEGDMGWGSDLLPSYWRMVRKRGWKHRLVPHS